MMVRTMGRANARVAALAAIVLTSACSGAPGVITASPAGGTSSAITVDDLRKRVYAYAADSMMGRDAPSPWNDKATDYIASEARRFGLEPAGENGTYFQDVLVTNVLAPNASITVGGRTFPLADFLPRWQAPVMRSLAGAQVVYGGVFNPAGQGLIDPAQAAGKVVVFTVPNQPDGTPGWQANRGALTQRYVQAAGIVVATLDVMPAATREELRAPLPAMRGQRMPPNLPAVPQFFYASRALSEALLGGSLAGMQVGATGRTVDASQMTYSERAGGARNVVAVLRGSDPALRATYVAIGSHNDHVGFNTTPVDHDSLRAFNAVVRPGGADNQDRPATADEMTRIRAILDTLRRRNPPRPDSIFNGADDDASGSMAMLEIAEAMASGTRPRRSVLFVWHTAEEDGLLGAQYFAEHPTVPRDSIVAQLNIDMIGRGEATDLPGGGNGYTQLIGSRRLSTELGNLVESLNTRRPEGERLRFDYQYDANGHPQQYYCRSDHYHYARFGIPVVFFSAGGHRDYHQVTDEPQYINYQGLRRITQFIHDLASELGNRATRPVVDQPKQDPNGQCRQ